jgi:predicted RNA-binding Zn ribbon-like protein
VRSAHAFLLVAKNPAIDFANTVVDLGGNPAGTLRSWDDLLAFLEATGTAPPEGIALYREKAQHLSRDCAATFSIALKLRDALRSILESLATGGDARPDAVEIVNQVLSADSGYNRLVRSRRGWQLARVRETDGTINLLFPIARAAADIVTDAATAGIRKCSNPACLLYFRDRSGRRRWCSMAICGNRAKVAAHWRRHR